MMRLATRLSAEERLSRLYTGSCQGADRLPLLPLVNLDATRALQAAPRFASAIANDPAGGYLLTLGYVNLAPVLRLWRPRARIVLRLGNTVTPELRILPAPARLRYLVSLRLAAHFADRIIVQSRYMGEDLAGHLHGVAPKLEVVYNFIENDLWDYRPPPSRPLADPYLFCAANMKPQKGFDVLLAAYARSPRRKTARLVIAGVDPADAAFTDLMRQNKLGEFEVVRLGFIPEIYGWIAHAETCVLASRFEGFSNFLLEAAALGKRIVATDCPGGNGEFFEHYPNVETVPVNEVEELAEAMATQRHDLDRAETYRFLKAFNEDQIYRRYKDILTPKTGTGPSTAPGAD